MAKKKSLKNKAKGLLIKAVELLTDPTVRKTSKFATSILEIISFVDKKNPISVGSGAVALVDAALEAFEYPFPTKSEQFAKKNKLILKSGTLPKIIIDAGLTEISSHKTMFNDHPWCIKKVIIDDDNCLYYAENIDGTSPYVNVTDKISGHFYYPENFNFEKLFEMIWSKYPTGASLSTMSSNRAKWEVENVRLNALCSQDSVYIGDIDVQDFANDIQKFREESIPRSLMLVGEPGTGKSSFAIAVARKISNRIVKIDPTMAHRFTTTEFDFLLENLRPDVIIFDDFDRAAMMHESHALLFLLENIKNKFPKTVVFATVNYFDKLDKALLRPGRFDEIIWFDLPEENIRAEILCKYLIDNNISYDDAFIKSVAEKTEGLTPVYIKELCIRMRHKGVGAVDSIISSFKRSLSSNDGQGYIQAVAAAQTAIEDDVDEFIERQLLAEDEGLLT